MANTRKVPWMERYWRVYPHDGGVYPEKAMDGVSFRYDSSRGIALIFVLVAVFCFFLFFLSFQYFSQSEFRHLDRVLVNMTLDYLVRAGFNIAEDKLQKGRWYGEKACRGVFEVDNLPLQGAKITIYADDYCQTEMRKIGKFKYYMLDHVKVFVEAQYKNSHMYGYAKFVISPEPVMAGVSTRGVDINYKSTDTCPLTFRKMINVRLLREVEIIGNVPKFSKMSEFASRKALAAYLKEEMMGYAKNYARNFFLSENIRRSFKSADSLMSEGGLANLLKGLDSVPPLRTDNQMKNLFILENARNFMMDTNWDAAESEKSKNVQNVWVSLGETGGAKKMDTDLEKAIKTVFGPEHPKKLEEGKDYWNEFRSQGEVSALSVFLKKRGISRYPDKEPRAFQDEISKIATRVNYSFQWRAVGVLATETGGTGAPMIVDGGAAAFNQYWAGQGNPQIFAPGGRVEVNKKEGPKLTFTNYYLVKGDRKLPLAFVFNMFLKYVDESCVYAPDEPKNTGWTQTSEAPPAGGGEGPPAKEWDDIGGDG